MTQKAQSEQTVEQDGLTIEAPPKEAGPEQLYRVVYVIDISAKGPRQAAERAYAIMRAPDSMRPVLEVLDSTGRRTRVDLSEVRTEE